MSVTALIAQLGQELGVKVDLTVILFTIALLMGRILPVIIFSPFIGGEVVPSEVKIGLGVMLGMVLFPELTARLSFIPTAPVPFLMLLLKEVFIGLSLSFVVSMVFEAAQLGGAVIDTLAGTNMVQVHVPQFQTQVSIFSSLNLQVAVVLFLTLNGHHLVIAAFAESLRQLPLDQFPHFGHGMWPFFELIIRVFADMVRVGLQLAAPVFISSFLADLALGMINRVAPQLQVFFIAMQIKPLAAVLMTFVALHLILERIEAESGRMLRLLTEAIRLLA